MNLTKTLRVRISEEIEQKYITLAEESGLDLSKVVRYALEKANVKLPSKKGRKYLLQIIRLMSKSSNNINQIAHHLNSLRVQDKLDYDEFIHYLRILDTIEAQNHLLLNSVKKYAG